MKKQASKVTHNRPRPFFPTVQPRQQPTAQNWFSISWNLGTRHLFSYLWFQVLNPMEIQEKTSKYWGVLILAFLVWSFFTTYCLFAVSYLHMTQDHWIINLLNYVIAKTQNQKIINNQKSKYWKSWEYENWKIVQTLN